MGCQSISRADENHVYLRDKSQNKEIVWDPMKVAGSAHYGVSVYRKEDRDVAVGDPLRIKTTRRQEGLKSGQKGKVVDVQDTIVTIEMSDGTKKSLDLKTMPHWDYDYTLTAFSAQGDEYKRAVVMAESYRRNLVNQRSFYVVLSRASDRVKLFTDNTAKLIEKVSVRLGDKTSALQGKQIDTKALFTEQGLVEETRREKQKQDYEKTMEGKLVKGATKIRDALEKVREDRGMDL